VPLRHARLAVSFAAIFCPIASFAISEWPNNLIFLNNGQVVRGRRNCSAPRTPACGQPGRGALCVPVGERIPRSSRLHLQHAVHCSSLLQRLTPFHLPPQVGRSCSTHTSPRQGDGSCGHGFLFASPDGLLLYLPFLLLDVQSTTCFC
jgi:hypothetical protein